MADLGLASCDRDYTVSPYLMLSPSRHKRLFLYLFPVKGEHMNQSELYYLKRPETLNGQAITAIRVNRKPDSDPRDL